MQESGQEPDIAHNAVAATSGMQATPVSTVATPTSKVKSSMGSLIADLLLYVVVSAVVSVLMIKFAPRILGEEKKDTASNIVVVDVEAIAREHVLALGEKVRDGSVPVDQMQIKTKAFSQAMINQFHEYARQGKIVLNANAVASIPEDVQDVTATIQSILKEGGHIEERKNKTDDKK